MREKGGAPDAEERAEERGLLVAAPAVLLERCDYHFFRPDVEGPLALDAGLCGCVCVVCW